MLPILFTHIIPYVLISLFVFLLTRDSPVVVLYPSLCYLIWLDFDSTNITMLTKCS